MRTTDRPAPRWNFLHPAWVVVFVVLAVAWIVISSGNDWHSPTLRAVARLAGYVGFAAMLVPYLHIIRRAFRARRGVALTAWLRWHIGAAYLAFFMVLIHSRGRANAPLTLVLLWLTWIVMISGVVGYYGQKLLYALMPRIVPREYGLERLGPEVEIKASEAAEIIASKDLATATGVVAEFCKAVTDDLSRPLRFSIFAGLGKNSQDGTLLSQNGLDRALTFADAKQQAALAKIWGLVEERRHMDQEYFLHQLGRLWLFVHGPAAWALLIVMVEHVIMSWWYGGF
jgi:hypothetical protein